MAKLRNHILPFRAASIRTKLVLVGIGIALLSVVPMIVVSGLALDTFDQMAVSESINQINDNLDRLAGNIYRLIEAQDEGIQRRVADNLKFADYVIEAEGGLALCDGFADWEAVNQNTRLSTAVTLPRMCVGETWLGQNRDIAVETPMVDQIRNLVGGAMTIFQPMNDNGDLLRVATTVPQSDTERAVGSFIPATLPDGTPNAVVTTVMRGETYQGMAYVWDDWYATSYKPILDASGQVIAVLFVGVKPNDFAELNETIETMQVGSTGYVYVLGGEGEDRGHYIISQNGKRDGENLWDAKDSDGRYFIREIVEKALALQPGEFTTVRYPWQNAGEPEPRWKVARVAYYEPWDWVIGVSEYEDDYAQSSASLTARRNQLVIVTCLIGLGIAVLAGILAWFVARSIATPLAHTAQVANALSRGDFSQRVALDAQDETGVLARAFNSMADGLQQMLESEHESRSYLERTITTYMGFVERVAKGDLTVAGRDGAEKQEEALDDLTRLGANLKLMVQSLAGMTRQIRDIAASVMTASAEIQRASIAQMESSSEQDTAVTQTMAAMEEVRATVKQTAERAEMVALLAGQSVEVSRAGQEAVANTLEGMQLIQTQVNSIATTIATLSSRTQQIEEIISTVNEIADQSKLLALNASIEAARAGKEGQGFAVVAMEVRQLADQSRDATAHVRRILGEIQQSAEGAVVVTEEGSKRAASGIELVLNTGESIEKLAGVIYEAAQAVTQIAASTQQQRIGIEQLATAMRSANQASMQAAATAKQTERSAQELTAMASHLQEAVARYRLN